MKRSSERDRNRLKRAVERVKEFIKALYPNAKILRRRPAPGIDASMDVIVPDGEFDRAFDTIGAFTDTIYADEGFEVVVHVWERSEWEAAQRRRKELLKDEQRLSPKGN